MTNELRDFAELYTLAWCSNNPQSVAECFSPYGLLRVNSNPPARGREAIAAIAQSFMSAFPDLNLTCDQLLPQGDRIAFHWTLTGTYAATQSPVRISGFELWHLGEDGLIADSAGRFDEEDYQRQITL